MQGKNRDKSRKFCKAYLGEDMYVVLLNCLAMVNLLIR